MLWGIVSLVLVAVIVTGIGYAVVTGVVHHRRDLRIVEMRNRELSVAEIGRELGVSEDEVRERIRKIAGASGPGPAAS